MVPQWDLLDLLADAAAAEPTFTLSTEHEVTGVVRDAGRVCGVDFTAPTGPGRLLADLTVACDGRWSVLRRAVGFPVREFPVGFDVSWFRITTQQRLGESLLPRLGDGHGAIAIPREGYVQVAVLGEKGTDAEVRAAGIEAFRAQAAELLPDLAADVGSIASMDDVKHLDVRLNRLRRWHEDGLLCIGDAAHAMSPVGGVGINLAVQDAVATARLLAEPLRRGRLSSPGSGRLLARVQRRRRMPTILIQGLQRFLHSRVIMPALVDGRTIEPPPSLVALLRRFPRLSAIPAFIIGVGPRPERAPRWARRSTTSIEP
jgi:2-polyprenyl-6-methoxyphenol hydroxylase-like FAD-dependent oxidoreductase